MRETQQQESPQLKQNRVINTPSVGSCRALKNGFEEQDAFKQAPIKFHTAGGRSISVSNDALQRARSLLGDPDVGDLFEEGDPGNSVFSLPLKRQMDTGKFSERNDCNNTPLVRQVTPGSNYKTKSFTFPLQSSRQRNLSNKFPYQGDGNNLITKFDAVGEENGYSQKSTNAYGQKKPLYGRNQAPQSAVYDSSLNGFSSKIGSRGGMSTHRPLADVSNTINKNQTINRKPASGKRRLGLSIAVSSFKRPRSSQIPVPSEQDVGKYPQGKHKLRIFDTFLPFLLAAVLI